MNMQRFWIVVISAIVVGFLKQLSAAIERRRMPKKSVTKDPTWKAEWNPNSAVDVAKWLRANLTVEEQAELAARGQ
jgi:hypothetical protein